MQAKHIAELSRRHLLWCISSVSIQKYSSMPILSRCCCWDIRNGSVASAFYSMIFAAIALGAASYEIYVDRKADSLSPQEHAFFIATCVDITFFSLLFVFSLLLLYGIKNNKRYFLLPYVVVMAVLVILQGILVLLLLIILISGLHLMGVIELLIVCLFTCLNLYCVLCVISHYQDLRDGRGNMRAIYRAHGTTLPHMEAPPEKSGDINNLENANFVPQYPGPPAGAAPFPAAYPGAETEAPPPYQPPAYPAPGFPKAELQH